MTEIIAALIGTIPSILTLAGIIYSIRVSQGNRAAVERVASTVAVVQAQTNHLAEALVASSKIVAHAEGKAEGIKQEQANPTQPSS